ncbi:hypothetical protein J2W40_002575 [Sphingobium xenophagum]|uniref:Uncharacterized protein n=1 Tax=Sphingobium xenophagum TaxID=121428 RepID=A0ABU1X398_SPHXE|nr:hypothetical protein [Sphingobium xenophagum]
MRAKLCIESPNSFGWVGTALMRDPVENSGDLASGQGTDVYYSNDGCFRCRGDDYSKGPDYLLRLNERSRYIEQNLTGSHRFPQRSKRSAKILSKDLDIRERRETA